MKMRWILFPYLCLFFLQAHAEQAMQDPQVQANDGVSPARRMSPRERVELARAAMADTNKQAGDAYLATNKVKPGVISLSSGVQYKILKAGTGKKPAEDSSVTCRYRGMLTDGSTFDKSDDKTPIVMHVAGFLPGLKEAVKLMPAGSKWEIVVPPQLAYGPRGDRVIGPNAVLIYVMDLVSVN